MAEEETPCLPPISPTSPVSSGGGASEPTVVATEVVSPTEIPPETAEQVRNALQLATPTGALFFGLVATRNWPSGS